MPETPRSAKRRRLNDSSPAPASLSSTRRSARSKRTKDDIYEFKDDVENHVHEDGKKSSAKKKVALKTYSRKETSPKTTPNVAASTTPSKLRNGLRDSAHSGDKALANGTTRSSRSRVARSAARGLDTPEREEDDELSADPLGSEMRSLSREQEIGGTGTPPERAKVATPRTSAKSTTKTHLPQAKNVPHIGEVAMDVEVDDAQQPTPMSAVTKKHRHTEPQLALLKKIVLQKLCRRRPIPLRNLNAQYTQLHTLLHATITAGESNSLLLIGARGSGKTALINAAIAELARDEDQHFHTIRLNGFLQTDDKLALREIWRQLGREMEIADEDEAMGGGKSYADTLTTLLALLSHPDEIAAASGAESGEDGRIAKSVVFVLEEFDLFAMHPRQTLLYNLLDIAQSRKAPIAVLGTTTRIDVVEALEKRVKSRFSHRYLHVGLPRSLSEFIDIGKAAVKIEDAELTVQERILLNSGSSQDSKTLPSPTASWNASIDALFADPAFLRAYVHPPYYTTKSVPTLLASLILPLSTLPSSPSAQSLSLPPDDDSSATALLNPPDSALHILPSLSELALALLIAAARLSIIHSSDITNFSLAYTEYISLASRARSSSAASGALASGAGTRVFGRAVARREWEGLVRYGLLVGVSSGAFGPGRVAGGREALDMVRVDVALEEIPGSVEMGAVMEKWCKQI